MSDDASATFRGFRHQALYVLWRILTDADAANLIYRPEGSEDLAVYDAQLCLVEAVQVKDYSSDLAPSALKPAFWKRFRDRRKEWPASKTKLATFGEIGPELKGAIEYDAGERTKVLAKLCEKVPLINRSEAEQMLDALRGNVLRPVASQLQEAVHDAVRDTSVGGNVETAIDLLMYWIFDASEQRLALTREDLLSQIQRIGLYLTALRDTSGEWGTSIAPISAPMFNEEDRVRWTEEYQNGVQAKWEHIVAGADCERSDRLAEIHRKLIEVPIVIIRGASGQGKSSLGWRYLHDYGAEGMRFHVRRVEGRAHASKIANALGDHVRKLKLKAIVYVDVSPSDVAWSELISDLAAAGLRVLVAVREEDFRRENLSIGDFHFREVALDRLTREEAEAIFAKLHKPTAGILLDFRDAWTRFSTDGGGPLLEFTHLVTRGELLQSRINAQIVRLQNDAIAGNHGLTQSHMELLALAAVVNETGARISLSGLYAAVGLSPISLPLHVLEAEYLLRLDAGDGGSSIAALHILRSKAVVSSLFRDVPDAWMDYAQRALPHILDTDIEPFLLAAFSRQSVQSQVLASAVANVQLRSWTHAAGIAGGLLWEGVNSYERRNRETILASIAKYDTAWWMVCDAFVASNDGSTAELKEAIQDVAKRKIEPLVLSPKSDVFNLFAKWAECIEPPANFGRTSDWRGAGAISHWIGHCDCHGRMRECLEASLPHMFPVGLDVESTCVICFRSRPTR